VVLKTTSWFILEEVPVTSEPAAQLRRLLAADEVVRAPGVFDGLSAHLARRAGFPAVYFTGAGASVAGFGLPDIGLVTATEMLERLRVVVEAAGVPVIADADTGYGNPMHVARTVRDYERAGAAAVQLEDQAFPKRCGHMAEKQVVDTEEFVASLRSALDARRERILIVARTDARGPLGLDEALARARRYGHEGADVVFVEAPQSPAEVERIAVEVDAPLVFNSVAGGVSPDLDDEVLARLGYRIVIHPGALLLAAADAMAGALHRLGAPPPTPLAGPGDLFEVVGQTGWRALDERYRAPTTQPSRPDRSPTWA
jgi:2-methylisocitrate lyase-like PEP mutase family enzyme